MFPKRIYCSRACINEIQNKPTFKIMPVFISVFAFNWEIILKVDLRNICRNNLFLREYFNSSVL